MRQKWDKEAAEVNKQPVLEKVKAHGNLKKTIPLKENKSKKQTQK